VLGPQHRVEQRLLDLFLLGEGVATQAVGVPGRHGAEQRDRAPRQLGVRGRVQVADQLVGEHLDRRGQRRRVDEALADQPAADVGARRRRELLRAKRCQQRVDQLQQQPLDVLERAWDVRGRGGRPRPGTRQLLPPVHRWEGHAWVRHRLLSMVGVVFEVVVRH
jgi:hypothetical protein